MRSGSGVWGGGIVVGGKGVLLLIVRYGASLNLLVCIRIEGCTGLWLCSDLLQIPINVNEEMEMNVPN